MITDGTNKRKFAERVENQYNVQEIEQTPQEKTSMNIEPHKPKFIDKAGLLTYNDQGFEVETGMPHPKLR